MIRVTINGTQYQIKTKWEEVDVERLIGLQDLVDSSEGKKQLFREELKCLTDIPHDIIDRGTIDQLWPFCTCISFIDDLETMGFIEEDPDRVEQGKYEEIELAKQHLKFGKPYKKVLGVALVYYPEEKDPVKLIGLGVSLTKQIAVFLSHYQDMVEDQPDPQEVAAGIEELSAFGSWGIAFTLGKGFLNVRKVYAKKALDVYTALYYSWKKHRYQKRLFDIKHPPKPK
jgi:hypothetical protein